MSIRACPTQSLRGSRALGLGFSGKAGPILGTNTGVGVTCVSNRRCFLKAFLAAHTEVFSDPQEILYLQ